MYLLLTFISHVKYLILLILDLVPICTNISGMLKNKVPPAFPFAPNIPKTCKSINKNNACAKQMPAKPAL